GKVAFVTGAASGIGYAGAQSLAAQGALVIGADINTTDEWASVEQSAKAAEFHTLDVRDADEQKRIVDDAAGRYGTLDILVTAAGVAGGGPVHLIPVAGWQRVQDINPTGTFLSAKAVLPHMIAQRGGSIITVASVEGLEGGEGGSPYKRSKGGGGVLHS